MVAIAFAFCVYGLLYPLPPTKHLAIFTVCTTSLYVTLVTLAMSYFTIAFLVNAAVST